MTGLVSLLLVAANAWAKRIDKSASDTTEAPNLTDNSINDLSRQTRTIGETLHDETRAVIRRIASDIGLRLDEIERRVDLSERHRREDMEEWRAVMKPTLFRPQMDALDTVPKSG